MIRNKDFFLDNELFYRVTASPMIPFTEAEAKEAKRLLKHYQKQGIDFFLLRNHDLFISFPLSHKNTPHLLREQASRDGVIIRRWLIAQKAEQCCTDE